MYLTHQNLRRFDPFTHRHLSPERERIQIEAIRQALRKPPSGTGLRYRQVYRGWEMHRFAGVLAGNQGVLVGELLHLEL